MWNERYAQPGFLFGSEPAQFLRDHGAYLKRGMSALAVADGEGRNSTFLAEKGLKVTAMDSSDVAIDKARGLAAARMAPVTFFHADLRTWDWEAQPFDLIVAVFIQFADPDFRDEIFSGMKRALKPGGVLMLHGYTPKQVEYRTGGPSNPENMYTAPLLADRFGDMEILHLEEYDREVQEGQGHSGLSALIDLIARKN